MRDGKQTRNIASKIRKPDYGPTLSTNGSKTPRQATWKAVQGTKEPKRNSR